MNKRYCPGLSVESLRSQRGIPMVKVCDYEKTHYLLVSELIADFNGSMARMASRGIVALGERAAFIKSEVADLAFDNRDIVYDAIGWNNGGFVDGNRNLYLPEGAPAGQPVFDAPTDRYRTKGTLTGWLSGVAEPFAGHSVAEFCFCLMFAGVLTTFTGHTTNPGFALVGEAEDGKSLLVTTAASACGAPTSSNAGDAYPLSFSATGNGVEEEMQNYSDMTMVLDEAALFGYGLNDRQRGREMVSALMNLAQGSEKKRRGERARRFSFAFIITANETPLEIVGNSASRGVIEAVNSRVNAVDLRGRDHGVLDFQPSGYTDKADFLAKTLAAAEANHGVALPHFVKRLVDLVAKNREAFVQRLGFHMEEFRRTAMRGQPVKASRRVLDAFGLVYVAGRLAQHLGALPEAFSPMDATIACYRIHIEKSLPPPRPVDIVAALLDDPAVRVLRRGERLNISAAKFQKAKGFKVIHPDYVELVLSPASAEHLFVNWMATYKHDSDIKVIMKREAKRPTQYRGIRRGERDRAVVFRIYPDWPHLRKGASDS